MALTGWRVTNLKDRVNVVVHGAAVPSANMPVVLAAAVPVTGCNVGGANEPVVIAGTLVGAAGADNVQAPAPLVLRGAMPGAESEMSMSVGSEMSMSVEMRAASAVLDNVRLEEGTERFAGRRGSLQSEAI